MNNWFEVKAKHGEIDEKGIYKEISESYLCDAQSFTEAEARTIKELEQFSDLDITNISKSNYTEIFPFEGDYWFKCKLSYITINEETGKETKKPIYDLVQANNIDEASINLKKSMEGSVVDYVVNSIQETKIVDIFNYIAI